MPTASHNVCAAPPDTSTFLSLFCAKKPRKRLSGDQNGKYGIFGAGERAGRNGIERANPQLALPLDGGGEGQRAAVR